MLKIPYYYNLIVINHTDNTTGRDRSMRFQTIKANEREIICSSSSNLYNMFPASFQELQANENAS